MSIRYQAFEVTGVANSLVLDSGLTSTVSQPLRVLGVVMATDERAGNDAEGWISQTRHLKIDDAVIDTTAASGTNQYQSISKINQWDIGRDLAAGEVFQLGIRCGGTATDLDGCYVYEVIGD